MVWRKKEDLISLLEEALLRRGLMCKTLSFTLCFLSAFREVHLEESLKQHIQKAQEGRKGLQGMEPLGEVRPAARDLETVSICWPCVKITCAFSELLFSPVMGSVYWASREGRPGVTVRGQGRVFTAREPTDTLCHHLISGDR